MQAGGGGRSMRPDHCPAAMLNSAPSRALSRRRPSRRQQRRLLAQAVVAPPEKPTSAELPAFEAWSTGAPVKKRTDLKTIMLLGAGPIVIGQVPACARSGLVAWRLGPGDSRASSEAPSRPHLPRCGLT